MSWVCSPAVTLGSGQRGYESVRRWGRGRELDRRVAQGGWPCSRHLEAAQGGVHITFVILAGK